MLQEIIALLIVAWAGYYTLSNTFSFFKKSSKGKVCSCSSCPSNDILKEIKRLQKR